LARRCSPSPPQPPDVSDRPHRARIPSSLVQVAMDEVLEIQVPMGSLSFWTRGVVYRPTLTGRSWTKGSSQMGRRLVGPTAVQSRRPGHALYVRTRGELGETPRPRYAGSKTTPGTTTARAVELPGPNPRLPSQILRSTPPPAALQEFDPADVRAP